MAEGLVDLNRVAQDGMRVRASAGAGLVPPPADPGGGLAEAEAQVEALRAGVEDDPAASDRRQKAARRAGGAGSGPSGSRRPWSGCRSWRPRRSPSEKDKARGSTTDPEATVMKMADGGFRPAYNVQYATATDSQVIVGVDVVTPGSDAGQMPPMVGADPGPIRHGAGRGAGRRRVRQARGHRGGAARRRWAARCTPRCPSRRTRKWTGTSRSRATARRWRRGGQRMGTEEAKAIYKERAATAECVNALARGRGLVQLVVRAWPR